MSRPTIWNGVCPPVAKFGFLILAEAFMRWKGRRQSENVEDRRHMSGGGMMVGGGLGTIVIVIIALLMGVNPMALLQQAPGPQQPGANAPVDPREEEARQFVGVVLAETEDTWDRLFRQIGRQYEKPKLVLFRGQVKSACGFASAAMGPFYCPADKKVYIDLRFFDELKQKLGAPGDFAQAYVIAHEVGHHVQNLLGTSDEVHALQQRVGKREANELSVRLELQADYLAGVWAHHAKQSAGIIEAGDFEEAINAAEAIGDDKLQMQGQGYVVPDSFTHGSSEQRIRWFKRGYQRGDLAGADTFSTDEL
jgi:predicted metalloprotease